VSTVVVLLIVWIAVAVVVLVVLGGLVYSLLGAFGRLSRELQALQREVAPVLAQVQDSVARAGQAAQRRSSDG
jgi:hypothetical protein